VLIGLVVGGIAVMGTTVVLAIVRPEAARRLLAWMERRIARVESLGGLTRNVHRLVAPLYPLLSLHSRLYGHFHFRALRRSLTAHLVTRSAYTGAGAVAFDGGPLFRIAQRPPFLRAVARIFPSGEERPIFEMRDLFFRPWSAFQSRRRLHLMIGDANLCEWALALRVGATALVIEAIESGVEIDWPALRDPLGALRELCCDSRLRGDLELADGSRATALELQRRYLEGVRRALAEEPAPLPLWKARILRDWEETLDLLERDPGALADRVDWIAKRGLILAEVPDLRDRAALEERGAAVIENGAATLPADRRLREVAYRAWRTDLRYHELGPRGGYRKLERAGDVRRLSAAEHVERARTEPPADTRAWGRGQAIKWAHARAISGGVAWHRARVGKFGWRWFRDPLDPHER
jgi:proteasome accessory factor A